MFVLGKTAIGYYLGTSDPGKAYGAAFTSSAQQQRLPGRSYRRASASRANCSRVSGASSACASRTWAR